MKKIPLKNYVILGMILFFSIIIVLYISHWFLASKNQNQGNIIDFIKEIKITEINNYITENPNFVIYLKSSNNNENKFEKKLKIFLIEQDLENEFVYINFDDFDMKSYTNFVNKYKKNDILINFSEALMIIDNQKIVDVLYKEDNFNIKEVKKFLKENGVY